jgi:hypothetical protein
MSAEKEFGFMATKSPKTTPTISRAVQIARILWRPHNRGPVLTAGVILASIVGLIVAWNRWGAPSTRGPDYVVTPDKIRVTPQPQWIHADVKAEVVRTANLSQLDLGDRDLATQVAQAFALHAWIAKVVRVEKRFPAAVAVSLEYRRPVAAVEVTPSGKRELLFVDGEGVLLPSLDFAGNQAADYLRIGGIHSTPASVYGSPWGDEAVAGAARVAAALGERFKQAGLYRILPIESASGQLSYELRTPGDTRVLWGAAPGRESSSEPAAEQKIAALVEYIADKGPLDRAGGERLLDLQKLAATATPRTAAGPSDPPR